MKTNVNDPNYTREPKFYEPDGFSIDGRVLTEEEQKRELTFTRFRDWMYEVGEDYVDQSSLPKNSFLIFTGYLIGKYPEWSHKLLGITNDKHGNEQDIAALYEEEFDDIEEAIDKFYADLAEFANHTQHLKAAMNANLILVMEHYNH